MLWYTGMKGAVAIIFCIQLNSKIVENATFCVVLFTNIFIGMTTKPFLKCLKIQAGGEEQLNVREVDNNELVNFEEEKPSLWMKFEKWVVHIDEQYMIRWFGGQTHAKKLYLAQQKMREEQSFDSEMTTT